MILAEKKWREVRPPTLLLSYSLFTFFTSCKTVWKITKEFGAVFIMQIGELLRSGEKHDDCSPDYDDWTLNGDILFWNPLLRRSVSISSMGISVDEKALL